MPSNLYNFYISDELKRNVVNKLEACMGKKEKGAMAALIRVLLNQFVNTPTPNPLLINAIEKEYTYSTKKNKRSRL